MKKLILIVLSFSFVSAFSQNRIIDSLKTVLTTCKDDTNKVITLNSLSEKYNSVFKMDSALIYVDQSEALAVKLKYKKGQGIAKSIKGAVYFNKGNTNEAIKQFDEALKILETYGDKQKIANINMNIGQALMRTGNFVVARESFNKSLSLYKEINNKPGLANAYNGLGNIDVNTGKYKDAKLNFESSIAIYEEINNKAGIANCYNNIGLVTQYEGNYKDAIVFHNKALKIREDINDKNGLAFSHLNIGIIHFYQSNFVLSKKEFHQAVNFANEVGNKATASSALNNLASVQIELGEYADALSTLQDALKIKEKINDKIGTGQAHMNMGSVYLKQGKYHEALKKYNQSLSIHQSINDIKNVSNLYHNIGLVHQFQGNYPLALQNYNQSLKIKEQTGDKKGIIESHNNIGTVYYHQGNFNEAEKSFERAVKFAEEIGDIKGMSVNLNNTGMMFKDKAEYSQALKYYQNAFAIKKSINDKEGIGITYTNIGDVYRLQKNYTEAKKVFTEALNIAEELGEKQLKTTAYVNLGQVEYETKSYKDAKKYSLLAIAEAKSINEPELIKKSNLLLSKVSYQENNYNDAEKHMLEAINVCDKGVRINFPIMSEKEQETYFNTLQTDYSAFYSLALNIHDKNPTITENVYNSSVRNKGLLLKSSSAMRNAILTSNDSALISKYQDWINFKKQIAKLYSEGKDATELESKSDAIEKELVKGSQAFSSFDKVQKITWKDVQAGLKKDEAAVEFIHFNDNLNNSSTIMYCALIIKPGNTHPEMIKLCTSKQLEEVMGKRKETDQAYINTIYGTTENPNTQLYNFIWLPLENSLKKSKTLYISPSGLLHKVAFSSISKSKNVYLCDRYNLNIQTNTGKITSPDNVTMNDKATVSIFGGINYENEKARSDSGSFLTWNYLPGTLTEAKSINNTLLKNNISASLYEDKNASEQQFKTTATKSNILHIATHGFFFPDVDEMEEQQKENEAKSNEVASRGVEYGYGVWSFVMNKNSLMRSGLVFSGANGVWNQSEQTDEEDGVLTAQEVANLDMRQTGLVVLSACETGLGDIKGSEGVYGLQRSFKMAGVKNIIMSLWQVPDAETEEFMTLFYNKLVSVKDVKKAFSETQMTMRKKYDPFFWAPFVLIE